MGNRAQFEAWFKNEIIETPDFVFNEFDEQDNEYIVGENDNEELYLNIQAMFMAWKASRAAIVVEPPKAEFFLVWDGKKHSTTFREATENYSAILRAAGITVKGD